MPGWLTHLGAGVLLSRLFPINIRDLRFLMLGAVIPDIVAVIYVPFVDLLSVSPGFYQAAIWYMQPFHTPFMGFFISLLIGLSFTKRKLANSILLLSGVLSHFLLDSFQKHIGFHTLLGYPFTYADLNFSLFYTDSPVFRILDIVAVVFMVLVFFVFREKVPSGPVLHFDKRSMPVTSLILVFILILPFITRDGFFNANYHQLQLFSGQGSFEGREIELGVSEVISLEPYRIRELDRIFELTSRPESGIRRGDRISVRGIYHDGKIEPSIIRRSGNYIYKIATSLAGGAILLAYLIYIWIRRRRIR